MRRRNFINMMGTAVIAAPALGSVLSACGSRGAKATFTGHEFPELPYAYDALEPVIDAQTMELHYSRHHRGYFDKFIGALDDTGAGSVPMAAIFAEITSYGSDIRNNGGGYYNHCLFWENMTPDKTAPSPELEATLKGAFGSVDEFKAQFGNAAKSLFGSGWAWLAVDANGKLFVTASHDQDNPLMSDAPRKGTPLLALDVWEHAYYLRYQNRRAEYVDRFWDIVNWDTVSERYANL